MLGAKTPVASLSSVILFDCSNEQCLSHAIQVEQVAFMDVKHLDPNLHEYYYIITRTAFLCT